MKYLSYTVVVLSILKLSICCCLAQQEENNCSARRDSCYSNCDSTTVSCGAADACFTFHSDCNKGCSSSYNACIDRIPKPPTMAPTGEPWPRTPACPQIEFVVACEGTDYSIDTNGISGRKFIPVRDSCDQDMNWSSTNRIVDHSNSPTERSMVYRSETTIDNTDGDGTSSSDGGRYIWLYRDKNFFPGYLCGNCCDCFRWYMYYGKTCGRSREAVAEHHAEAYFYGDSNQPWTSEGSTIFCENGHDGNYNWQLEETDLEIICNHDAPWPKEENKNENGGSKNSGESHGLGGGRTAVTAVIIFPLLVAIATNWVV